jgi:Tfp pilus assembly protein PilP
MGYTLVGIVELGDRSVALFDTQGLTKRLSLGESLGNWRIVAIDNQQVKLSHNGMIKSLSLGQSF